MWFFSGLKTSLIWLRNGLARAWNWIAQRPVGAAIALIVALPVAVIAYRMSPEIGEWLDRADVGQIIVNSPTVYTRQRLVNDRLSQTQWLEKELKKADRDFRSIAQVRKGIMERAIRLGEVSTTPQTASGTATLSAPSGDLQQAARSRNQEDEQGTDGNVNLTTAALFRAKNSFREEIRAEITQTQLDDRHDIQGNTIYRLAFDATILAGTKANAVAGIKVTIAHHPYGKPLKHGQKASNGASAAADAAAEKQNDMLRQLYDDDYRQVYLDWIRYTQTLIERSVSSISSSISLTNPDPRVRQMFTRFLLIRICEFSLGITGLNDKFSEHCDPEQRTSQNRRTAEANQKHIGELLDSYIHHRFSLLEEAQKVRFLKDMERLNGLGYDTGPEKAKTWLEVAQLYCREFKTKGLAINVIGIQRKTPTDRPNPGAGADGQPTPPGSESTQPNEVVGCPFYDSPSERIAASVLLYTELYNLRLPEASSTSLGQIAMNDLNAKLNDPELIERNCRNAILFEKDVCRYPNQDLAKRCFAADFVRADLNTLDRRPEAFLPMSEFLKFEISGREISFCQLVVSALPDAKSAVKKLESALNKSTEAFAYSISPKNLSENISTSEETRDAIETLLRFRSGLDDKDTSFFSGGLSRKRADQVQATFPYPLVVGFGSSRLKRTGEFGLELVDLYKDPQKVDPAKINSSNSGSDKSTAIRTAIVGWLIAPRLRTGRRPEQIDGQHSLTAVISVPSWWRSVELDIEACWISREELRRLSPGEAQGLEICKPGEAQVDRTVIRLPGVIQELSRKLGFEVIQEPYLNDEAPQRLEVDEPGYLLLSGGRLWRSTEVTVGSQKADSITVLPNMDGIVAKFNCVLPQSGNPRPGDAATGRRITSATLRVWTSEGVTPPGIVELVWPDDKRNVAPAASQQRGVQQAGPPVPAAATDIQGRRAPKYCPGWYDDIARPDTDAPARTVSERR